MRIWSWLLCITLLTLTSSSLGVAAPPYTLLTGGVYESGSGSMVNNGTVRVISMGKQVRAVRIFKGRFSIHLPRHNGAQYTVAISAVGYQPLTRTVLVNLDHPSHYERFELVNRLQEEVIHPIVRDLISKEYLSAHMKSELALRQFPKEQRLLLLSAVCSLAVLGNDIERFALIQQTSSSFSAVEIQNRIFRSVLPELAESYRKLRQIPTSFRTHFHVPNPHSDIEEVEVDYTDIVLLMTGIQLARAIGLLSQAYQIEGDWNALSEAGTRSLSMSAFLERYPRALTIQDVSAFEEARGALLLFVDHYLTASQALRSETDDQQDDLVSLSHLLQDISKEQLFRVHLTELKRSLLSSPTGSFGLALHQWIDLGHLFTNPIEPRQLVKGKGVQEFLMAHLMHQVDYLLHWRFWILKKKPSSTSMENPSIDIIQPQKRHNLLDSLFALQLEYV